MTSLKNCLLQNKLGGFYTQFVVVIILFVTDIIYLVGALVTNTFFDAWVKGGYVTNVQMANILATLRNVGPIVIVTINVGLIIYLLASAWKRGSNEVEDLQL